MKKSVLQTGEDTINQVFLVQPHLTSLKPNKIHNIDSVMIIQRAM